MRFTCCRFYTNRNVRIQDIFPVQKLAIKRQVWRKSVVLKKSKSGSTDLRSEWQRLGRPDVEHPLSVGRESPGSSHSI